MNKIWHLFSFATVVRDYDGLVYFREWSGGILAGGFEPVAKPAFLQGIPNDFQFGLLPDDWDHFRKFLTIKPDLIGV